MALVIGHLQAADIDPIAAAFKALGWKKSAEQYVRYLAQQEAGQRVVFVAHVDNTFAGYVTVKWVSDYPPFREANIPEISDFNVLPSYRRQGIGSRLLDDAEKTIGQRSAVAGIGVGMYADYGTAQRKYVRRGYVPDGRGLFYRGQPVQPGESVTVDDDLALYFTKQV